MNPSTPTRLGQGLCWQDLHVGQQFATFARTITETDLVNFISVTGMLEEIFIDTTHAPGAMKGRPVPAALTYSVIEGFIMQSMIQGTGLAMLEMQQVMHAPVMVGDTISAVIEVTEVRPTSKGGRAVVATTNRIHNQRGELVITYTVKRLLAGRSTAVAT